MTYDPGWANVTAGSAGPTRVAVAPANPWATLAPVADGNMDVDFVLLVRDQYPTFEVRDAQPVEIRDDPLKTP